MLQSFKIYNQKLDELEERARLLITTINAHSYNVTRKDELYRESLLNSDVLIPDGVGVIFAIRWLTGKRLKKIAGADLFNYEMKCMNQSGGKCFFLGSTESTLNKIKERAKTEYPNVQIETYSPPYRNEFSDAESQEMIQAINSFGPDVLMIGMTAPKQEKWAYQFIKHLNVGHVCCIGAVFDFYSGNIKRAPEWMIMLGFEWLYRLIKEPKRMWKRYLMGNIIFIFSIVGEKLRKQQK